MGEIENLVDVLSSGFTVACRSRRVWSREGSAVSAPAELRG
jgi:hypothetical protein